MRPLLAFDHVTVRFDGVVALEDVTFRLDSPAFLVILGPNGAGKSTLLRAALGLVRVAQGRVEVLGMDVAERAWEVRRAVGYVPQRESVDPSIPVRVRDIVMMGRARVRGPLRAFTRKDRERAMEALRLVGLDRLWDAPYSHLSGGQRQRVLIARALASEPRLLLLDEPLAGVDASSQRIIVEVLRRAVDRGVGVVMVTHDVNPVMDVTDYVMLLNRRVIAFGRPTEKVRPELLTRVYGRDVKVFYEGGSCYVLTGGARA